MNSRKNTRRLAAIPAALTLFFAGALAAQAAESLVGEVPFGFTVGKTTFAAGSYQFEVDRISRHTVSVRSLDGSTVAIALSHDGAELGPAGSPAVTFSVDGERKSLSAIQLRNGTTVTLAQSGRTSAASSVAIVVPE